MWSDFDENYYQELIKDLNENGDRIVRPNSARVVLCVGIIFLPARYIPSPSTVMQFPCFGSTLVMLFIAIRRCGLGTVLTFRSSAHGTTMSGVKPIVYQDFFASTPLLEVVGSCVCTQDRHPKVASSSQKLSRSDSSFVVN